MSIKCPRCKSTKIRIGGSVAKRTLEGEPHPTTSHELPYYCHECKSEWFEQKCSKCGSTDIVDTGTKTNNGGNMENDSYQKPYISILKCNNCGEKLKT